jgi:Rad3-related DNA helicase
MKDAFSGIIGHESAVARLRKMLANGAFPHALAFHGPRRLGKATLALAAAGALLGTPAPERHPDFRLIARPRDEKTDKLKKLIPIDAVRELKEHMRMSAFLGGAKVAVIDEADLLSEEAANALLKTLEEPSPRSTIILCAESLQRLPKTIVSRSALIGLRRVSEAVLVAALETRGLATKAAEKAAAQSDGRPGAALGFLEGGGMVDWYETEERRWRSLRGASAHRRFAALADLAPPRADREETVQRLRGVLDFWRASLRKELLAGEPSAPANLRRLQTLHASLDANVQPRALLERFALTLDR